ncbi:MAG: hypothetical protein Q7W56_09750 [Candidatus Latescibacteria bacterium]|nr:hypothetical protein [Candidatus Latescibacterota bacterium]
MLRSLIILVSLAFATATAAGPWPVRVPADATRPDLPPSPALRGGDPGCAGAPVLAVAPGLDTVITGDTAGGVSAVDGYGCVGWNESGPESVLLLDVPVSTTLHLILESDVDLDLFLLSGCDSDLCVAHHIREFVVAVDGRPEPWVVVIDGYQGAAGPWSLTVRAFPAGVPPEVCTTATPLLCRTASSDAEGSLYGLPNQLFTDDCAAYLQAGGEQWYAVSLADSARASLTLSEQSFDAALWLFDGCEATSDCVAFADRGISGVQEVLVYRNLTGARRTYYLAVDAAQPPTGEFDGYYFLESVCTGGIVPNETTAWGTIKSFYR